MSLAEALALASADLDFDRCMAQISRRSRLIFLLDTNVISELRRPDADRNVVAWANAIPAANFLMSASDRELELAARLIERKTRRCRPAHLDR